MQSDPTRAYTRIRATGKEKLEECTRRARRGAPTSFDGARILREVAPLLPQLGLSAEALRIEPQKDADYLTNGAGRTTTLQTWLEADDPC